MRMRQTMAQIICKLAPLALAVVSLLIGTLEAQTCTTPRHRAKLIVSDTGGGLDTLWFGVDDSATVGIDVRLCETEYPPFPPADVFHARWLNPPGREGIEPPAGLGQGVIQDYRRYVSRTQVDTHRVKLQPNEPPGYPVKFTWLRTEVVAICDSCVLVDELGGVIVPRIPMTTNDSLIVNQPAIQSLLMIRYGSRLTGVEQMPNGVPGAFALEQNYPNPFNPSTSIRFAVQHAAMTDISVYDILGRKVVTLAWELLAPGYYTVHWDGSNSFGSSVASGVYFVRMNAQTDNGNFSALHKLLFMK